jgi:hypothetical protein
MIWIAKLFQTLLMSALIADICWAWQADSKPSPGTPPLLGQEQISIEIPPVLDKAFYLFEKMGFKEVANLKGFVKDLKGTESDLVLMVKYLQE